MAFDCSQGWDLGERGSFTVQPGWKEGPLVNYGCRMPAPERARQAESADPKVGLRGVAALRRLLEQLESLHIRNARTQGWSWQGIADELGGSEQAGDKKNG